MNLEQETEQYELPSNLCMQHAVKMSIVDDRPIMLDYWTDSCDKNVVIGVRGSGNREGEKMLVKSSDEYTSPIVKLFKVENEFIVITENSLYIVRNDIETQMIK